jgi:homoserine trans-succinylase
MKSTASWTDKKNTHVTNHLEYTGENVNEKLEREKSPELAHAPPSHCPNDMLFPEELKSLVKGDAQAVYIVTVGYAVRDR